MSDTKFTIEYARDALSDWANGARVCKDVVAMMQAGRNVSAPLEALCDDMVSFVRQNKSIFVLDTLVDCLEMGYAIAKAGSTRMEEDIETFTAKYVKMERYHEMLSAALDDYDALVATRKKPSAAAKRALNHIKSIVVDFYDTEDDSEASL